MMPPRPAGHYSAVPHGRDVDEDEVAYRQSPGSAKPGGLFGNFGMCCQSRQSPGMGEDSPVAAPAYAGVNKGDYIEERVFKHVGDGNGTHKLHDESDEEETSNLIPWCCLCFTLIALGVVVAWLFSPEGSFSYVSTSEESDPTGATIKELVVVNMVVHQVDWSLLSADSALLKHFTTELQQAIAIEAGNEVKPEDITIHLTGGSVVVRAEFDPPEHVSAGRLRSELASSSTFRTSVIDSLRMTRGLGVACADFDKLDIDGFNAFVYQHPLAEEPAAEEAAAEEAPE